MKKFNRLPFALLSLLFAVNAHATPDAIGDFLPSFTGVHNLALDIHSADVTFNAVTNQFTLHAQTGGAIAGAANVAYVFGFDVGGPINPSPFASIGEGNVVFNKTVTLKSDGTGAVGATPVLTQINGFDITAVVSASLLPSTFLTPGAYRWSLWSIDSSIAGLPRNADFAPENSVETVAVVPEPSGSVTMLTGLALLGFVARRRFKQ